MLRRDRPPVRPGGLRPGGRLGSSAGQASLEYAAVLGVVLVVLATGGLRWAPGLVNSVVHGMRRALCEVTGGPCPADERQACTVRSGSGEGAIGLRVVVLSARRKIALVRATQSDGSVVLTVVDTRELGVAGGFGVGGRVRVGRRTIGLDLRAQAELVAAAGRGESWQAADVREADRLQRALLARLAGRAASSLPVVGRGARLLQGALGIGEGRRLRPPDTRSGSDGGKLDVKIPVLGNAGVGAGLSRTWSEQRSNGRRTYGVKLDGGLGAALAGEALDVHTKGEVEASLTVARDGTPLLLTLAATGEGGGAAAFARPRGGAGGEVHAVGRLDLTVPANLAAVRRLLAGARGLDPAGAGGAAAEVGARMAEGGRLDVALYGRRSEAYGAEGGVGLGARVGVEAGLTRSSSRLLDAWSRPVGGVWERRLDCLSARV